MMLESLQLACTTCANTFKEGGGDAAGWAIFFMLCVTIPVLGGVGVCMVRIARREALDPKFQDNPIS